MQLVASESSAEKAILKTLTYFDVFSFPLTTFEVWKWLYTDEGARPLTLKEVTSTLQVMRLQQKLEQHEGFWVLKGSNDIVAVRKARHLLAEHKHRRLQRAIRWFRFVPYIRTIALCNSAAYNNARTESDLDLLVITEPGRIWTVRMFTAGIAKLFGWRPTPERTADGICLSFFLSKPNTSLEHLTLMPDDPYMRYWLDQVTVVYGDQSALDELRSANRWYAGRLPNAHGVQTAPRRQTGESMLSRSVRRVLQFMHQGAFGAKLERAYKQVQLAYMPLHLKQLANADSRVVVSDAMLKFHDHDRRAQFAETLSRRLQQSMSI